MERIAFQTDGFSVVVCRHPDGRFLAVNESKNRGWWLPAGHVDRGQTFVEAAIRETIEEAGINVILKGVLAVEHTLMSDRACRMRVIFYAEPNDPNQTPKTIPDKESNGAAWLTLEEIEAKRNFRPPEGLRGEELLRWGNYLKNGGLIAPMSVSTDGSYEGFFRNEDSGPSLSSPITSLSQPTPLSLDVNRTIGFKCWTQLHKAVAEENLSSVQELLLRGADPNRLTHKGRTALHFAASRGNLSILRLLLLAGGDPLLCDFEGKRAFDAVAECSERDSMVRLLNLGVSASAGG